MRADARRNRELLVTAAAAAFAEHGVEASLEEIARRAGVGVGTLYRHFPTRDALVEAVYRREVEQLCDAAEEYAARLPADEALAAWMQRCSGYVATKRGLGTALKAMIGLDAELFSYTHERIRSAADTLLAAAAAEGSVRSDIDAGDLLKAISGICLTMDQSNLQEQSGRVVGLLMDGLRYGAPNPR